MGASAQKHAAQTAADTSLQVADKNNAFAQSIYDQNAGRLDPYSVRGNTAGDAIMALLMGEPPSPSPTPAPTSATGTQSAPVVSQTPVPTSALAPSNVGIINTARSAALSPAERAARAGGEPMARPTIGPQANGDHIATGGMGALNVFADHSAPTYGQTGATAPPVTSGGTTGVTPASALSAFDQFRNSTNYQFRLNQGLDATASKYAAGGAFESGAEKQAINDYAQNFASNELANYMDRLSQQEGYGLTAASSLAGVGTNLVSQVSANNRAAGDAAANAALSSGQATANMYGGIGSAISGAAGTIGGALSSSYHPATTAPAYTIPTGDGITGGWFYPGIG
jgi:hypothetical protein